MARDDSRELCPQKPQVSGLISPIQAIFSLGRRGTRRLRRRPVSHHHRTRSGTAQVGRGRQRVHRLRVGLRVVAAGPLPPGGGRSPGSGSPGRVALRLSGGDGAGVGRARLQPDALRRQGEVRGFRGRINFAGHAHRPGLLRQGQDRPLAVPLSRLARLRDAGQPGPLRRAVVHRDTQGNRRFGGGAAARLGRAGACLVHRQRHRRCHNRGVGGFLRHGAQAARIRGRRP